MEATKIERKDTARYGIRAYSWQGIVSSVLLLIQIILLLSAVYLSYLAQGAGGIIVGILGVTAFILALAGIALALWGITVKKHNHGACYIGGLGSLLVAAGIIVICTIA